MIEEKQQENKQPKAIAVIGLMFIVLGIANSGLSQALFIIAGALFLLQFAIKTKKAKN